jgi:hypothetical protein
MTSVTPRALAEVLLKVWAITLVVEVVLSAPTFIAQMRGMGGATAPEWRIVAGWTLVQVMLRAIVAVAVFKYGQRISSWLVRDSDELSASHGAVSFETVALGTLGVYYVIEGLRESAGLIFQLAVKPRYANDSLSYLWEQSAASLIAAVTQTVAGAILLLGRGGLIRARHRLRGQEDMDEQGRAV